MRGMRPLHLFRLAPALGANAVEDDTRTRPSREIEAHLCARHVKNISVHLKAGSAATMPGSGSSTARRPRWRRVKMAGLASAWRTDACST